MKKQLITTYTKAEPLKSMGENIKQARQVRGFSVTLLANYAGISRSLLYKIESGNPSVAVGAIYSVLMQLGMENDFVAIAYRKGLENILAASPSPRYFRSGIERDKKRQQ